MRRLPFATLCALTALAGCYPDNTEPTPPGNANPAVPAQTVTATSDTVPTLADALIRTSARHSNHGGAQTMMVKITQSEDDTTRALVKFDQAAIAAAIGSGVLTGASLELGVQQSGTETNDNRIDVHRILLPWTEAGVTWRCGDDLNTANASADCPSTKWRMSGTDMDAFLASRTDRVHLTSGQSGVAKFNVMVDLQAFLGGAANHGWLVTAGNSASRTVVLSRETTVKPRLILSIQEEESVPEQAPSSLPSWVYDATNLDSNTAALPGAFLKNIVIVEFVPSATLSQRQAAVAFVNGAVVGGVPSTAGEGHYYLSVPDDSRGEGLVRAVRQLESLPQVRLATYEFDAAPAFRRPRDNATWSSWHIDRKTLNSENWSLEAVLAPLAWGCSTGNGSLKVALVDGGFPALPANHDVAVTVHPAPGLGDPYPADHGVKVGSILAASGDNRSGMTGIMWSADLHGYDVGAIANREHAFVGRVLQQVKNAADDGAQIINISLWVPPHWPDSTVALAGRGLDATLASLGSRARRPLVVLAAGNGKRDASTAGYPRVANGLNADQVIVVAASTKDSVLWVNRQEASKGSNFGELVTVAAPGAGVYFTTATGAITADDGTSAAAPIVSGIAGLLLSFDPMLHAADLKRLIVEGASAGNWKATREADGKKYDIVNAYESLKLAAQRPGAPLCGNRIWANAGIVFADRSNGPEALFAHDGDDRGVFALAAHHGGREIDMISWTGPDRTFKLSTSGEWFRSSEPTELFANQSGVANSLWGLSHDGDKEAFTDIRAFDQSRILRTMLFNGTNTTTTGEIVLPQLPAFPDTLGGIGRGTNDEYMLPWAVAYSPTDDYAVAAVSVHRTKITFNGSGETPCPWSVPDPESGAPSDKCFDSITREMQPVKAELWKYPLPSGQPERITTLENTVVNSVAISEDGTTMIINEGMKYEKFDALPSGPEGCSPEQPGLFGYCVEENRTESNATCSVTYRSVETGDILEPRIPALYACELPVGTMAAVKAKVGMKARSLRQP